MSNDSVLVVGAGGREHAIAWALAHSPQVGRVLVAPGNAGTAQNPTGKLMNVPVPAEDQTGLIALARREGVALVVIGPEGPIAAGLTDALQAAGQRVFGPSQAAGRLEASKAFAKAFMAEVGIPTAAYRTFDDLAAAEDYVQRVPYPVVIKASGLAAGKGVLMAETPADRVAALRSLMQDRTFGAAGDTVVIEERLSGPEVSLLAFCDGRTVAPMPPARDHKRACDGDTGPNTGGMGVYAPVPGFGPDQVEEAVRTVLQPAVDGLAARGMPYVGVLYAGLMLTGDGPRVLEFNCRFGDPETQVILPLLDSDLHAVMRACVDGRLDPGAVRWRAESCAAVVMASGGYPGSYARGKPIAGIEAAETLPAVTVFQAGTAFDAGQVVTDGGRVLAVSATGASLPAALQQAYAGVEAIHFEGAFYRKDIGQRELNPSAYTRAGVNIDAGMQAVALMKAAVAATYGPEVLSETGSFGGLYDASGLHALDRPVLVASMDGVGTKTRVAAALDRWDTVGQDLVNHCINDILVQGARPLFFLDYVASARLDPARIATIVGGCAAACRAAGCALLGGETAEMPGVYAPGEVDVAGTIVGVVDHARLISGARIQPGDAVLGLPSSGLHTNGFSLARAVLAGLDWTAPHPDLGQSIGDALLAVHRSYLPHLDALWAAGVDVRGLAHITGGGVIDNLPRILPPDVDAVLRRGAWAEPPIFGLIQRLGGIDPAEMFRVFNMGLGMLVVVPAAQASAARDALPGECALVGEIVPGARRVRVEGLG